MNRRSWLRGTAAALLADRLALIASAASDESSRFRTAAVNGRGFLASLFDPALDLLPEYREAKVYWLYHDNYLAAEVLENSHSELSKRIQKALQSYGIAKSGKIEIVFDAAIRPLPFRHPELIEVKRLGNKIVKTEIITDRAFKGWEEYADLLLMAAMALSHTEPSKSKRYFAQALAMWDGMGFKDRVTLKTGKYAVYKLALAVIATGRLDIRPAELDSIIERLLVQQSESGGWITDYTADGKPVGLANVETTSLAVLAIDSFGS
ncbi:MAG TPA: hypothetical protein QF564_12615 [Pirellulaceae bacterium]|nr:hypothetical protein [Pirellulaceae bacterium]